MRDDDAAQAIADDEENRPRQRRYGDQPLMIRPREHTNDMRDDESHKADHARRVYRKADNE